MMACASSTLTIGSSDGAAARSTGTSPERIPLAARQRRVSYHVRRSSGNYDAETIFLKVSYWIR